MLNSSEKSKIGEASVDSTSAPTMSSAAPRTPETPRPPLSPWMASKISQSPRLDNGTFSSESSGKDEKCGRTTHTVYRVDSDDTLTQSATHRLKSFKDFRNPTDPTHYALPREYRQNTATEKPTIREYKRSRQRIRIMLNSCARLLFTGFLCGMCAFVLGHYERKGDLGNSDSQWLNALMTGLPLFIGLNYRSSLQSYARNLRWWILARWDWKLRQFDLILDAASSKAILKLIWESKRHVRSYIPTLTQIACVIWLAVNLSGAVGIALLSLTYQLDQSTGVLMKNGNTSILDITNETFWAESAHYYGASATPVLLFTWVVKNGRQNYNGLSGSPGGSPRGWASCRTCTTWNYTFQDWDPTTDLEGISSIRGLSNRYLTMDAACKGYKIVNTTSNSILYRDAQNDTQILDVPYTDKPWGTNHTFWDTGVGATYVQDTKVDCGPRCANTWIISTQNFNKPPVWLYNCTNTVSPIGGHNIYDQMSDKTARAFASASSTYRNSTTGEWQSYKKYDWAQSWVINDPEKKKANDEIFAASTLGQFSITALANADHVEGEKEWLPDDIPAREDLRKTLWGKKPYQALKVSVSWAYAIAIMCAVPGLQLAVLLTIVFFANDVIVKDESHLNAARLLAPVAQRMSHRGSLLQVDEVVERFGDEAARYRYGWELKTGVLRVGILERLAGIALGRKERKFPEGQYD